MNPKKYTVCVISYETGKTIKTIDCGASERKAERVEQGVNRSMNHEKYYTIIEATDAV